MPISEVGFDDGRVVRVQHPAGMAANDIERLALEQAESGSLVDSLANGAFFGWPDEIAGAVGGAWASRHPDTTFSEAYTGIRDAARRRRESFETRNPKTALGAEVAGGLLTGGAGAARAGVANVAARAPALTGAGVGAFAGLGVSESEAPGGQAVDAGVGGLAGGLLGRYAQPAVEHVADAVTAPIRYASALRESRPQRYIAQQFARDGISPEQASAAMARMGPAATLADVGGENVRRIAENIYSMPGEGAEIVRRALETRRARAPERVERALERAFGTDRPFHESLDALEREMQRSAAPLYREARSASYEPSEAVRGMLDVPFMRRAVGRAEDTLQNDARNRGNTVALFDLVKRNLDDAASEAARAGRNNEARMIGDIRRTLVADMDAQVPVYAQARAAYGGPAAQREALEMGRDFLRMDPEEIRVTMNTLLPSEREFFQVGAMRALRDRTLQKSDTSDVYKAFFNQPLHRLRIRELFDNPRDYARLARAMRNEGQFFESMTEVLRNSATARRLAGQEDLAADVAGVADLASGHGGSVVGALNHLGNWSRRFGPLGNESTRTSIAELMFRAPQEQQLQLLRPRPLLVNPQPTGLLGQGAAVPAGSVSGLLSPRIDDGERHGARPRLLDRR